MYVLLLSNGQPYSDHKSHVLFANESQAECQRACTLWFYWHKAFGNQIGFDNKWDPEADEWLEKNPAPFIEDRSPFYYLRSFLQKEADAAVIKVPSTLAPTPVPA